jgi:outer membrane receptor protein involved in Fe transport
VAYAQQETLGLEEIIVTAQKREESLQNVPVSIQAIGTERLQQLNISSYADYAAFLPSLSYQNGGQAGGPGFSRSFMRGVASGETANHSGPAPSVGTYLDEQPITMISGAVDVHIYDIARVEALAGPQGTLYGASSQAGTLRIITNRPDPAGFDAGYDLELHTLEHGNEGYVAEGFVNLPVSANSAVRLVGWYEETAGYIDNVRGTVTYPRIFPNEDDPNTPEQEPGNTITIDNADRVAKDYNDGDKYGARAALRIDLNDNWTVTPSAMGQKAQYNGSYGYRSTGTPFEITRFNPEESEDRWWQVALTVEGRLSNFDVVYAGAYLDRQDEVQSDYVDYSYFYDCCYAPSYGGGDYIWGDHYNGIDITQFIQGKDGYEMLSQELRLSSNQEQRFRYVAGLFYARQEHDIEQRYVIAGLAGPEADPGVPSLEVTGWPDTWWLTKQLRTDEDYAAFGELYYDITDKLTATAGIRFFKAEGSLEGFFGFGLTNGWTSATGEKNPLCAANPEDFNGAPCKNLDKDVDEDGDSLKLNLTYRFTDDALVYATYSEGFRPGGVNRVGDLPPYQADYLYNYELGWKSSWADNRLRFNGALYYLDWEDFQYSFLGPNSVTQIVNAGNAEIKGVEAELNWAATDNLTVSLGAAYTDAKLEGDYCGVLDANGNPGCIDADGNPAEVQAPDGQQLPVTPEFKGNVIARYNFTVGALDAFVQGAAAHVGSRWADLRTAQRDVLGKIPSYTVANFSAGLSNDTSSLELFVSNAFDEEGQVDRWAQCDALICGLNGTYVTPVAPRTIGIRFGQRFGL